MKTGSALVYLLLTKLKNSIKNFLKSPGKLTYLIFIVLILAFVVFSGNLSAGSAGQTFRPAAELYAMVFVLFTAMFFLMANGGFNNGGSFFSMGDVNLIFPAPLKPQSVLFYGLCQQVGTSLLVGFFILFQYSWLHQLYGVGLFDLIAILIGYGLTVFLGQTVALVIYSTTSGDEGKRRIARIVYVLLLLAVAAYIGISALTAEDMLMGAVAAANSLPVHLFPLAGWMSWAVVGVLTGDLAALAIGGVLSVAGFVLIVGFMTRTRTDFYEDVLKSAETVQSAITARKEGNIGEAAPRNVKVGKTGLGRGWGASAFFYKHMLENRRSRILFFSPMTLLFLVMSLGFGLFLGGEIGPIGILAFSTYMQVFGVMLGRINKELIKPFIYLVPDSPFRKLVFSLMEALPGALAEAVVLYLPLGIVMKLSLPMILVLIVARVVYALLFLAGNVMVERLWGGVSSRVLVMTLYIFAMVILALPGIVVAAVAGTAAALPLEVSLLILTGVNLVIAMLTLFLCRNMLEVAELNQT